MPQKQQREDGSAADLNEVATGRSRVSMHSSSARCQQRQERAGGELYWMLSRDKPILSSDPV